MSRRNDRVLIRHMLDHAVEAAALIQDKTRKDLEDTRLLQLGLVRLVEIVGEAAARPEYPKRHRPDIRRFHGRISLGCETG